MSFVELLAGIVIGSGATWLACRQGLKDALKRLDGDFKIRDVGPVDVLGKEPGYREPADVEAARIGRVFCGGCRFENERKCMAAPVEDSRGSIDQVTGLTRPQEYEVCVIANKNYDCKKKVLK